MWVEIKEHGYKSKQIAVMKADRLGCYTVDSDKRGITYIFSGDEMAIVTNDGYFRTDLDSAKSVAVEILALLEDRKDLKRMGVML